MLPCFRSAIRSKGDAYHSSIWINPLLHIRFVLLFDNLLPTRSATQWTDSIASRQWAIYVNHANCRIHVTIRNRLIFLTYRCAMFHSHTEQTSFVHVSSACVFGKSLQSLTFTDSTSSPYRSFGSSPCRVIAKRRRVLRSLWKQRSFIPQSAIHCLDPYTVSSIELTPRTEQNLSLTEPWLRRFVECLFPLLLITVNMLCVTSVPVTRTNRITQNVSSYSTSSILASEISNSLRPLSAIHKISNIGLSRSLNSTHRLSSDWFNTFPLIKLYMRSQRTRRSLEYYMSTGDSAPLFLTSKTRHYLSITDDGQVRLIPHHLHKEALMTIGVIVEPSQLKNHSSILSNFKPHDNTRVIIRRFQTNICLCMAPSGIVGTERLINHTVTDNCQWRLRVSRHGIGLEHLVYYEDPVVSLNPSVLPKPMYRVATLSAHLTGTQQLASGWLHKLWQPQATWNVYKSNISHILSDLSDQFSNNSLGSTELPTVPSEPIIPNQPSAQTKETAKADQSTNSSSDEHTPIKVGGKQVLWFQTPAQDIIDVQQNFQKQYCIALVHNLSSTVQHELLASLKTMNSLRTAYHGIQTNLGTSAANQPSKIFLMSTTPSLPTLLNEWLLWTDHRWQNKIKRLAEKSESANVTLPPACALSFSPAYINSEFSRDSSLNAMLERHAMTKIYYDLFLHVQHLARWSASERLQWLRHPRLPVLLRYIGLRVPSAAQLRQAIFVLRRYLPEFDPKLTNSLNSSLNYGVNGTFGIRHLNQILHDRMRRKLLLNRAVALKFEELRSWPQPIRRSSGKVLEHTPISVDSLRAEIRQLGSKDYCYTHLLSLWYRYVRADLTPACTDQLTKLMSASVSPVQSRSEDSTTHSRRSARDLRFHVNLSNTAIHV